MPGPITAPMWSIALCRPNARPRSLAGTEAAMRASRGELRIPLPIRSENRTASPCPEPDREENREERIDHIAGKVGKEAPQPEGDDVSGKGIPVHAPVTGSGRSPAGGADR